MAQCGGNASVTTQIKKGMFMWSGGAGRLKGIKVRLMPHQGWTGSNWEAAKAVEDWYDRLREINGLPPRGTVVIQFDANFTV